MDKILQPCYVIEPETCKYSSILRGYNKWYIFQIDLKKETTNTDEMENKYELVLRGIIWAASDDIGYNNIGAFQTSEINMPEYCIVQ